MSPLIVDEIVALDLLTRREHAERAGDALENAAHRRLLEQSLADCELVEVRRAEALVAYAMPRPQDAGRWFVHGFDTHPGHRNGGVFRDLFKQLAGLARRHAITALRHVHRTNQLSMAFHRRLGFKVTRENGGAGRAAVRESSPGRGGAAVTAAPT